LAGHWQNLQPVWAGLPVLGKALSPWQWQREGRVVSHLTSMRVPGNVASSGAHRLLLMERLLPKHDWHGRVVSPSPAWPRTCGWRGWGRRVSPTCLACAPRRGPPVAAAAAGCTETTREGRAETGGHGAEGVGREAWCEALDPRSVTVCRMWEMAPFAFLLTADVRLGMAEGGGSGDLWQGQGKRR